MSNAIDEQQDEDPMTAPEPDTPETPDEANTSAGEAIPSVDEGGIGITPPRGRARSLRIIGLVVVVAALAGASAFLTVGLVHQNRDAVLRAQYVETARGGTLNLLNVSFDTVDQDVDRLLGNASGAFQKDFGGNADNYKSVVKQAQVTSTGEVVEAALENVTDSGAVVLIAAQAKITNLSVPAGEPRSYRLRVSVGRDGDRMTISDVQFVA